MFVQSVLHPMGKNSPSKCSSVHSPDTPTLSAIRFTSGVSTTAETPQGEQAVLGVKCTDTKLISKKRSKEDSNRSPEGASKKQKNDESGSAPTSEPVLEKIVGSETPKTNTGRSKHKRMRLHTATLTAGVHRESWNDLRIRVL